MEFQLKRLILIDSYSTGRIVQFPLSGGAVLTGRNGRGKTSLLQLIPIFFGESPNRIVGTETNRLNFAGYYLPRSTSYIVFEYRRRDVMCMVVMNSSESGQEIRYRFVRSGYRSEFFVQPDGTTIISARDLHAHLKRLNVICTEQLSSVAEYRSIIQGKVSAVRDRQRQRALVADFAFVGSGHHLTHIEKIVSGMFLRRTNFEDLQRMVVSCISDEKNQISLSAERRKIESWPEHYEAYRAVMAEAVRMTVVDELEAKLIAAETELGRVHARGLRLREHLEATAKDNREARGSLQAKAAEEESAVRHHANQLETERGNARREAEDKEERIKRLDATHADYAQRDLAGKAALVAREPLLVEERKQFEQRRETLLGEQGKISLQYERMLNELAKSYNETLSAANMERDALSRKFEPRFAQLERDKGVALAALRKQWRVQRAETDEQLKRVVESRGEWEHRLKAPQADPALETAYRVKQDAVEVLRHTRDEAERDKRQLDADLQSALQAFDAGEHKLRQLHRQREEGARQLQSLHLRQSPGQDSLLYFLRTQRPAWVFDIANVIREDLLVRTDLAPQLLEAMPALPALYGVELDLESLDAHLAADESALQAEVVAVETRLKNVDDEITAADRMLGKLNKEREAADRTLHSHVQSLQQLQVRYQSQQEEERSARTQLEKSRQAAQAQANERLKDIRVEVKTLETSIRLMDDRLASDEKALEDQHARALTVLQEERDTRLAAHDALQRERAGHYQKQRTEVEQERDHRLRAQGVDTEALKRLDADIGRVGNQIAAARAARDDVAQWQLWQKTEWPQRDALQSAAIIARKVEQDRGQARARLDAEWKTRSASLTAQLKTLDDEHKRLDDELIMLNRRLLGLSAWSPDPDTLGQAFDLAWTLASLANQANQMQRELSEVAKTLQREVSAIQKAFTARRGTPPDQFFDTHRAVLGPDASARAWIAPLRLWFGTDHDQFQRMLKVEANQIAGAIVAFHHDMEAFHRRVQQFNRELQQSLDENIGFESISKVTVEIVSAIRQLEYWQSIEQMAEAHRAWLSLEGNDLPPQEFAATLRSLLEHWEVREGIRAELPNLIRIQGEVVENGQSRVFRKAADLERVSSNGLSYLILCVIFIAFINRIRRQAKVEIVWALDELKDLDIGNIEVLIAMLTRNSINLASAFPDPDADVLSLFRHRFSVEEGRRLLEARVVGLDEFDGKNDEVEVADV